MLSSYDTNVQAEELVGCEEYEILMEIELWEEQQAVIAQFEREGYLKGLVF